MNAIETLKALRVTLAAAFAAEPPAPVEPAPIPEPAPIELEMKEYVLVDGSKIMLDKLEAGGNVTVADSTGAQVAAPDAEYNLADGSSITTVGGLITEVTPVEPAVEPEPDIAMEKMKAENAALKLEVEELKKATNEGFATIINLFESLIKEPAKGPIETPKTFAQIQGISKAEKFAAAAEALQSFKQHKNK